MYIAPNNSLFRPSIALADQPLIFNPLYNLQKFFDFKGSILHLWILVLSIFLLSNPSISFSQSLGLNNPTPDASSILDMAATDRGVLIPRMTQAERDAIALPATALLIFQTNNTPGFYTYNGTTWVPLFSTNTGWALTGNDGTVAGNNFLGTTDAVDFRIRTNNANRMTILSGGNVGIGTTTPSALLELASSLNPVAAPTTWANYNMLVRSTTNTNGQGTGIAFVNTTIANNIGAAIIFRRTGGYSQGELQFYTKQSTTNGVAPVQAMVIDNAGYVGVGTTAPASLLHIDGGTADAWINVNSDDFGTYNSGVYLREGQANGNTRGFKLYYNSWDFYIDRNDGGTDANVLFIDRTNGNIGIGTTVPAAKLHVAGTIRGTVIQATTNGAGAYQYDTTTNMNVPDYVFDKYYTGNAPENPVYEMLPLDMLEKYIRQNRHLPRVPSRSEINKDGFINTQAISMLTLEKTEENTLYILELNKIIKEQQEVIEELRNEINKNKQEMELIMKSLQLQLNVSLEK